MRVITLLSVLLGAQAWGQPSFIRRYQLPPDAVIADATVTPDGGVVISGHVDGPGDEDTYGLLMKLDQGGGVQWSQQEEGHYLSEDGWIERLYDLRLGSMVTLNNGDIIAAGRVEERGVNPYPTDGAILARYSSISGELQWVRTQFGGGSLQTWPGLLALKTNGELLYTGTQYSVNNIRATLMEVAPSSGNVTDYIDHYSMGADEGNQLNGGAITGFPGGGSITVMSGYSSCHVVRLSSTLGTIWENQWPAGTFTRVEVGTDGTILASGPTVLQQLLPDGSSGWALTLGTGSGAISSVTAHPSGGYYLLGNVSGPEGHGWLAHIGADGTLIWSERYGDAGEGFSLARTMILADGSLRLVGRAGNDLLVLATDAMGQLSACTYPAFGPIFTSGGIEPENIITVVPIEGGGMTDELTDLPITALILPGSLYCSSDIWVVSGTVFADLNANSAMGPDEPGIPLFPIEVLPENSTVYTLGQGTYQFATLLDGEHTFSALSNYPWWVTGDLPSSQTVDLTNAEFLVSGINFGFVPAWDTTVIVAGLVSEPTRCDLIVTQTIALMNQGTTEPDLVISINLDPLTTFVSSNPAPDSAIGTTFYWSLEQLGLFQTSALFLEVQMPDFEAIGEPLNATIEVRELMGSSEPVLVATHDWNGTLTCGYDPNDKLVEPVGEGYESYIPQDTEWLTYTVRFQNTGNDTAFSVVVRDLLNPNLQRGSIQVLSTSHQLTQLTTNAGGLVSFHFDNILLPDSTTNEQESHGHVRFRLRLQEGLEHGTEITNSASIHFDLNPPVVTNTVLNTVQVCEDSYALELVLFDGTFRIIGNFGPGVTYVWQLFDVRWYLNGEPISDQWDEVPVLPGNYTAILTRYNSGCIYEVGPVVVIATALHDDDPAARLQIAPNPFNDQLQIHYPGSHDRIELVDVNGRVVLSRSTGNATTVHVEREGLAAGIYLVRMMQGTTVVATARVVAD
jgi:hypothetical protein